MRQTTDQVNARWRIDVGNDECFCYFDIDLEGRTYTLTAEVARELTEKLIGLLSAAERFAVEEAARAALAGR
jgi:hypothetical protein